MQLLKGPDTAPVIDFNADEIECPACGYRFKPGPQQCPDCELFIG